MLSPDSPHSRTATLSCENIWKLFGRNAKKFLLTHNGNPSNKALSEEQLGIGVRNATLSVFEGEIFVIMGLSGSGKSTLIRVLSRLIEPTAGAVFFEGTNLLEASRETLIELRRHKMGMVFQHFALLPHLSVLNNVAFPLEVQGIDRTTRFRRAQELIDLVDLTGKEKFFPRELSGGQQQRVGIARSLAVEPDILFLDEPFSALDPLIRDEMQGEFLRIQNLLNKTIVFITHDFNEAVRVADRIAIMKDGEVIQIGTPEELVITPVNEHVTEFTRNIPRAKVLTARTVMSPTAPSLVPGVGVSADDKIEDIAELVMSSTGLVPVLDNQGSVIGTISASTVTKVLLNQNPRHGEAPQP